MNETNNNTEIKKEWTAPSLQILEFKNTKSGVNIGTPETTNNATGDQS